MMNSNSELKFLTLIFLNIIRISICFHLNQNILFTMFNYTIDSELVDLNGRDIESIDLLTFNGMKSLKLLHLEYNRLTRIEYGLFSGLTRLREIWLESNQLITIDRNAFVGLNQLELVCLHENPISNFFPTLVQSLCQANLVCNLKIAEKCVSPLSIYIYFLSKFMNPLIF
jgi:hypothetical protein